MSSTQHQLIEQCATRLRGIVEALDNIHDTSPQRWSTDLDDVHSSAESLLALIKCQTAARSEASFEEWLANELEGEDGQPVPAAVCDIALARRAFNHWPKLEHPAKVGGVRFSAGVSSRLVVEAAQRLNEFESTPEQEAERPEVVAYRTIGRHTKHQHPHYALNYYKQNAEDQAAHWRERDCEVSEDELMTVAQHARIVGALRADAQRWREQFDCMQLQRNHHRGRANAALARVAELEIRLRTAEFVAGEFAPVAQAGQVPDILTEDDMKWLRRFAECCEDSDAGGHDLPKAAVKQLVQIGALRHSGPGRQETTAFGDWLLDTTPVREGSPMSKVQRFWCDEARNIRCVREDDFDALEAEAQALREQVARSEQHRNDQADLIVSLRTEVAALRARVAIVPDGYALVPVEPLLNMMSDKDHDTRITAERQLLSILAAAPGKEVPQAWIDVQEERRRQITAEGWTPEHDDEHDNGEMARAAACYALAGSSAPNDGTAALLVSLAWPWDQQWWKPTSARRDLVKACALALAEIERLDRACISQSPQPGATTASS